jgi:RNA-directed DNA polymerase
MAPCTLAFAQGWPATWWDAARPQGKAFDFLGFTDSWRKSRKGKDVVRQTTAKSRFARSLAAVKDCCRTNRHRSMREQRAWLSAVLNGHYAYYGITGTIGDYRNIAAKS